MNIFQKTQDDHFLKQEAFPGKLHIQSDIQIDFLQGDQIVRKHFRGRKFPFLEYFKMEDLY